MQWQDNQLTHHLCSQLGSRFSRVKASHDPGALGQSEWRECSHDYSLLTSVYASNGNLEQLDLKLRDGIPQVPASKFSSHVIVVGSQQVMRDNAQVFLWEAQIAKCRERYEYQVYADTHTTIFGDDRCYRGIPDSFVEKFYGRKVFDKEGCIQVDILGKDCDMLGIVLAEAGPIGWLFGMTGMALGCLHAARCG